MSMTFYETDNRRQQVEILRRFSTEIFKDTDCDLYSPYTRTEEIEEHLLHLFFSHNGVTSIALYYGCPEIIIMKKILSMNLYARYDELVAQLRNKERILGVEDFDKAEMEETSVLSEEKLDYVQQIAAIISRHIESTPAISEVAFEQN